MTTNKRNALAGVLIAAGVAACEQPQEGLRGEFKLMGSTSDTLPLLLQKDPLCTHTLESGSMIFHDDTLYSSTFNAKHVCKDYPVAYDDLGVKRGVYRAIGDTILFYNNQQKFTGATVALDPDTLIVQGSRWVLRYVRQSR